MTCFSVGGLYKRVYIFSLFFCVLQELAAVDAHIYILPVCTMHLPVCANIVDEWLGRRGTWSLIYIFPRCLIALTHPEIRKFIHEDDSSDDNSGWNARFIPHFIFLPTCVGLLWIRTAHNRLHGWWSGKTLMFLLGGISAYLRIERWRFWDNLFLNCYFHGLWRVNGMYHCK